MPLSGWMPESSINRNRLILRDEDYRQCGNRCWLAISDSDERHEVLAKELAVAEKCTLPSA
jgi:hypothetical protein